MDPTVENAPNPWRPRNNNATTAGRTADRTVDRNDPDKTLEDHERATTIRTGNATAPGATESNEASVVVVASSNLTRAVSTLSADEESTVPTPRRRPAGEAQS